MGTLQYKPVLRRHPERSRVRQYHDLSDLLGSFPPVNAKGLLDVSRLEQRVQPPVELLLPDRGRFDLKAGGLPASFQGGSANEGTCRWFRYIYCKNNGNAGMRQVDQAEFDQAELFVYICFLLPM